MNSKKCCGSFVVLNDKGLHTRPCTELVKCASSFHARVLLHFQNVSVDAKSLLGILMLAATKGSKIEVEAEGDDAEEAVRSIIELASNKFYIHY